MGVEEADAHQGSVLPGLVGHEPAPRHLHLGQRLGAPGLGLAEHELPAGELRPGKGQGQGLLRGGQGREERQGEGEGGENADHGSLRAAGHGTSNWPIIPAPSCSRMWQW